MAGPTQLALALLMEFARDTRQPRTINQLALSSGKAYANIHAAATELLRQDILTKQVIGHGHHCLLNLQNDKTLLYLSLLQSRKRDELLEKSLEDRKLLKKIDELSAEHGTLLAWRREKDVLLITTGHTCPLQEAYGIPIECRTLREFLANEELCATIGAHTLLFGHALYASLHRPSARYLEVLQ